MVNKILCFQVQTSLAFIIFTILGLNLVIERWAIADGIPGVTLGTETGTEGRGPSQPISTTDNNAYTQAMLAGYAAAEVGNYEVALVKFQQALTERSGDKYALAAIANMETYIRRRRELAARRQRMIDLQGLVDTAIQSKDWACAATSIDELMTLVPANSLDRSRLVAYRGELSALLDARADIEHWSTVCPGG